MSPSSTTSAVGPTTGPRTTAARTTDPRAALTSLPGPDPYADLRDAVGQWFGANARDLPWRRDDCSPWGVLVSEVMLQQTPVVRVEPAWRAWMERWPDPADLAAAATADVLRAWGRLGYPRR
ncbi:hypothetical protein DLJ96_16380, partial [Actinotalea fermentans ATCC 43279 = JCM 9966 = DSM 3133]